MKMSVRVSESSAISAPCISGSISSLRRQINCENIQQALLSLEEPKEIVRTASGRCSSTSYFVHTSERVNKVLQYVRSPFSNVNCAQHSAMWMKTDMG